MIYFPEGSQECHFSTYVNQSYVIDITGVHCCMPILQSVLNLVCIMQLKYFSDQGWIRLRNTPSHEKYEGPRKIEARKNINNIEVL